MLRMVHKFKVLSITVGNHSTRNLKQLLTLVLKSEKNELKKDRHLLLLMLKKVLIDVLNQIKLNSQFLH